ncbi:MAG: hypothetical protein Q7R96_00685 [Nanoarchaeota archaeon]|nr:hypothetical protein [Nanoarchaeota archaeon]
MDDVDFRFIPEKIVPDYTKTDVVHLAAELAKTADLIEKRKINDNAVLVIRSFNDNNLDLAFSTFGEYKTYKELVMAGKTVLDPSFDLCSLIIETITNDDHLVLGYRQGEHLSARYLAPAGFTNFDSKNVLKTSSGVQGYLEQKVAKELGEEVGLRLSHWHDPFDDSIQVTGLGADTKDSFLTVLNLTTFVELDKEDTQLAWEQAGNEGEHPHLIYLPNNPKVIADFVRGTFTGNVGTAKKPIVYREGVCTEGPDYIKGKPYQLIENGIAGMLLAVRYHFGEDDYQEVLDAYQSTGKKVLFRSTIGESHD